MTILAAIDGERSDDPVVRVGDDLARAHDDELVVLHVMPQEQFEERRTASTGGAIGSRLAPGLHYGSSYDDGARTDAADGTYTIDQDAEPDAASVARNVASDSLDDDSKVSVQGRVGDPTEEILREADRRDARYLVIGGRQRSPVGKALFGSTAQSVLLGTDRPVVTVSDGR